MSNKGKHIMEHVNCLVCQQDYAAPLYEKNGYSIVRCQRCEPIYVNPMPSEEENRQFHAKQPQGSWQRRGNRWRPLMNRLLLWWIERWSPPGRLLEIGCVQGDLLYAAARSRRWEATGIDLNLDALDYARGRGLDVHFGTVEELSFPDAHFDACVLWHVLEQIRFPERTLTEVRRILRRGGALFISVPNIAHPKARHDGINWKYLGPGHLWYFTPSTLRDFVEQMGFRVRLCWKWQHRAHVSLVAHKTADGGGAD
jgi:SAM-dependent methyltransferase